MQQHMPPLNYVCSKVNCQLTLNGSMMLRWWTISKSIDAYCARFRMVVLSWGHICWFQHAHPQKQGLVSGLCDITGGEIKVDNPYSVTILNMIPIPKWYVVRCESKHRDPEDMCLKEIGLSVQIFRTILGSIVSIVIEGAYMTI